jgi:hypothetical protein
MDQDRAKDWRELCKAAANEPDPNKLMALIAEITGALDEQEERRNMASENLDRESENLATDNEEMASHIFPASTVV